MEPRKGIKSKGLSVDNILNKKFNPMEFEGVWRDSFGRPDIAFSMIIWGGSSEGKTALGLQLAKYLTNFGRVAYDSLEEGASHTIQMAMITHDMRKCGRKFILLDQEPIPELITRMEAHKSPNFYFIDSVQYANITIAEYKKLKEKAKRKKKGLIFISHARGKEPKGSLAEFIRYDVDLKIPVKGYRAFPEGRLNGGGKMFDIWPEKSATYWAEIN